VKTPNPQSYKDNVLEVVDVPTFSEFEVDRMLAYYNSAFFLTERPSISEVMWSTGGVGSRVFKKVSVL
jgi:hypothetical protein